MTEENKISPQDNEPLTADEIKQLYPNSVEHYYNDILSRGRECIEFGERYQLWVNLEDNWGTLQNVSGWLLALAVMQEQQASSQARWEMSGSGEHTQFAVDIANSIHDIALQLKDLTSELAAYQSHYLTILAGRRSLDINYTTQDGDFVLLSELTDCYNTTAAIRFNNERLAKEERIRRHNPLLYCEYVNIVDEFLPDLLSKSEAAPEPAPDTQPLQEQLSLPLGL